MGMSLIAEKSVFVNPGSLIVFRPMFPYTPRGAWLVATNASVLKNFAIEGRAALHRVNAGI